MRKSTILALGVSVCLVTSVMLEIYAAPSSAATQKKSPAHKVASKAAPPFAIPHAVTIALPGDLGFEFKKGPGQEAAQSYCITCHSSAYVKMQPVLGLKGWQTEVTKMVKLYGAPIPEKDQGTIAQYLTTEYGPDAK